MWIKKTPSRCFWLLETCSALRDMTDFCTGHQRNSFSSMISASSCISFSWFLRGGFVVLLWLQHRDRKYYSIRWLGLLLSSCHILWLENVTTGSLASLSARPLASHMECYLHDQVVCVLQTPHPFELCSQLMSRVSFLLAVNCGPDPAVLMLMANSYQVCSHWL